MKALALIGLAATALVLGGCDNPKTSRLTPVRVFMHQPGTYSFLAQKPDSKELVAYGIFYYNCKIIVDVPDGEPMWAEVTEGYANQSENSCIIHIHSLTDINGAEWRSGKNSTSSTIPIE
jgi:hypothetical protein